MGFRIWNKRKGVAMNKNETTKKGKTSSFSIKAKVALLCTVFILITSLFNTAVILTISKNTITDSTESTMLDLAAAYGKNVTDTIDNISDSVNFLSQSDAIRAYITSDGTENSEDAERFITMSMNMNDTHEEINLINADGVVLYSSNTAQVGKDLSSESYISNMISNGQTTVSDVFTSETSGDTVVTFAIPIMGGNPDDEMGQNMEGTAAADTSGDGTDAAAAGETSAAAADKTTATTDSADVTVSAGTDGMPQNMEISGAITITVKVSEFSNALSSIKVGDNETSYAYLVDSTGTIVYHPTGEKIGTKVENSAINELVSRIQSGDIPENQVITYTYDGKVKYASYNVDDNNHWILVITVDKAEVLSSLSLITTISILLSLFLAIVLSLAAYIFAGTIANPIKKITRLINKTSELDFTADNTFTSLSLRKDETGEMSRAIDKMRDVLKTMIIQINEASNSIFDSAENLTQVTESVNEHASDNSATAEELSASMEETAATTDFICTSIDNMGKNSEDINQKASAGSELSDKLIKKASELKVSTNKATENTKRIYLDVKEKTTTAIEQSKAVDKINSLTNIIKEIANQTSLLALNASIEAARAGDAGKGFSVVASEIGTLAEQSSKTVTGITDIVKEVNSAVSNMTSCLEQTLEFLEHSVLTDYNNFQEVSNQYNMDASNINESLNSIHKGIDSLNTNLISITNSIGEINAMVNDASKGVNDVAEKNTEIVSLTTSTHNMVKQSKDYAENLKEIVDKFKL